LLRQIADLMVLPDADDQFLLQLQSSIVQYRREKATALASQATGTSPQSAIGDVAPMPAQQMGEGGGAGMVGLSPSATMNPDDLRRVLQGAGG